MARQCRMLSVLFGFTVALYVRNITCKEVTLLDTTMQPKLEWVTYSSSGKKHGWTESTHNTDSKPTRIYTVCEVTNNDVDNWLRTPYIARNAAKTLYIEIQFTMRRCTQHDNPRQVVKCKETFNLYQYTAESDFATAHMPTWDGESYRKIKKIAADHMWETTNNKNVKINKATYALPISRRGVYFAIQDTGACMMLYSIRVYYIMCDAITQNLSYFEATPAGLQSDFLVKVGVCVNNAVKASNLEPSMLCQSTGEWKFMYGVCQCLPGYEPNSTKTSCDECRVNYHKWRTGNYACQPCPAHSSNNQRRMVECACDMGYYRNSREDKSSPCSKPPSEPRDLRVYARNEDTVKLTWHRPKELGGRQDLWYSVVAFWCSRPNQCVRVTNGPKYSPAQSGFNVTHVVIRNLDSSTTYKIAVFAHNGVSHMIPRPASASLSFMTSEFTKTHKHITSAGDRGPFDPDNEVFNIIKVGDTYVVLGWNRLNGHPPHSITLYEVFYYPEALKTNFTIIKTNLTNYTFRQLKRSTKYGFKIRGKLATGWSNFSRPVYILTGHDETDPAAATDNGVSMGIIAGAVVAVLVCMAIAAIMVILMRRNRDACGEKNVSECDTLQYTNVTVPLFQPPGSTKTYVDPHTYEDPNQAVREFAREIDASCITIESVIGGGEFGDVCKGRLLLPGKPMMNVAIKTLKAGATDKNRLDFLTEASIMGQFDNRNVISLEGVVTKSNPIMIITEYMDNGSLDTFLRNNDGKFTVIQLVGMMHGVAFGMKYLSDMGYVHRDLAARNILINASLVCKVSDFGLSREISNDSTDGAYTTKGGKIPVRWTAPEAIAYRKFTTASDVWGYGVVMWEVMSYGERPYWNWSNQDVIQVIERGYRLPPPMDCPEAIHKLMLDCWKYERCSRPSFGDIVESIKKLIRHPENLRKVAKPRQHFGNTSANDLTLFTTVEEWLMSIKMEHYIDNFLRAGYTSIDHVTRITIGELINIGVHLAGHQKKIMNSIQTLRMQIYGTHMSEGFLV